MTITGQVSTGQSLGSVSASGPPPSSGSAALTASSAAWNSPTRSPVVSRRAYSRSASVKRGSPARRRRRRSSNSSSPMLTPPLCHPDKPFGELHERRGSRYRPGSHKEQPAVLSRQPPADVFRAYEIVGTNHGEGCHRMAPARSPRSAESTEPRIGGSRLRIGHAARQRSDQGSSMVRGRGPRVQVGPPTLGFSWVCHFPRWHYSALSTRAVGVRAAIRPGITAARLARMRAPRAITTTSRTGTEGAGTA